MQTQTTNTQYHEDQLTKLRYTQDIREVMCAKPNVQTAPEGATGLALNVNDGEHFGKWQWLTQEPSRGHVYFEPVMEIA